LEEICCSNSAEEFVSSNLTDIQDVLANNLTTASSVSKAVMEKTNILNHHPQLMFTAMNLTLVSPSLVTATSSMFNTSCKET
jgi:hypothetical protein